MSASYGLSQRVVRGIGGFVLADALTGMVAFSVITLVGLWIFCSTWIHFQAQDAAMGLAFGTTTQLFWAWVGAILALPGAAGTIYLAVNAYRLPISLFRKPRTDPP